MSDLVSELVKAAQAVGRIDRHGAYTNVVVDHVGPDPVGRIRALVYETIRRLDVVDAVITEAADRDAIDPQVRDLLRVTLSDLAGGRPAAVVVDCGVEAVASVAPRAKGFANAVLRRIVFDHPTLPEPAPPQWLAERLAGAWGPEDAAAFWGASIKPAPLVVRTRPGISDPALAPVAGIPGAYMWTGDGRPRDLPVQDAASIAVVRAMGVTPEDTVIEIGAAPGGKTAHLCELGGQVVALDSHPRRTRTGAGRVPGASWVLGDGRRPPFADATFPRVLLDAPCTGLGTLRRRPEIRFRVDPNRIEELAVLQRQLLDASLALVEPGGRMVYAVCTVTPEETIEVVKGRGFHPPAELPGRHWGDGLLLAPHLTDTDGMFIAVGER